jgi:hypothetical protein
MMAKKSLSDGHSFAIEGLTGTSCSTTLRNVGRLAAGAPSGRSFAAIATLTEISRRIEGALVASEEALVGGDEDSASLEWARAVVLMDRMTTEATSTTRNDAEPSYLRRRAPGDL